MFRVPAVRPLMLGLLLLALGAAAPISASGGDGRVFRYAPGTSDEDVGRTGGFGSTAYAVDDEGTLWLSLSLHGAAPVTHHDVYLVCGPTVAESCGYALVGAFLTDEAGDSAGSEWSVPAGVLAGPPFGPGPRLDHLTVIDADGAAYVSDPLAYDAP